jgi:hypothetical protein
MACTGEVEKDILEDLEGKGPCSIDEMLAHLPGYTWNQVFSAVDRLSRNAQVTLQHHSRFGFHISLAQVSRPVAPETNTATPHRSPGRFDDGGTTNIGVM